MIAVDDVAKAAFLASLPRGPKGQLIPGHTTWDQLGPESQERWRRITHAVIGKVTGNV